MDYRACVVGGHVIREHVIRGHDIECRNGAEALARAAFLVQDNDVEVWRLDRVAGKFNHKHWPLHQGSAA